MKKHQLLINALTLFFSISVLAETAAPKSVPVEEATTSLNAQLKSVFETMPDIKMKRAIEAYLEVLGLDRYVSTVGNDNEGIDTYFKRKKKEHPCFNSLYEKFQGYVQNVDTKRYENKSFQKQIKDWPLRGRPSLKNVTGTDVDADLTPGWAWEAALKFANGDTNLAMSLLGAMGHDDIIAGVNSSIFTPQSLGKDVDISDDLKKRIVETQAQDSNDARVLPAKYYHVIGAAFMSCQLVQQGLEAPLVHAVETNAARMYRGMRLCSIVKAFGSESLTLPEMPALLKEMGIVGKPTHTQEVIVNNVTKLIRSGQCNTMEYVPICAKVGAVFLGIEFSPDGEFDKRIPTKVESDLLIKKARAAIGSYFTKVVAAKVFEREYIGNQQIKGKSLPYTNIQTGARLHDQIANAFNKPYFNDRSCGESYSDETCKQARDTLQSWMIDFDWTIAQHEVGAKFASDKCKKLEKGESPFAKSCDALAAIGLPLPAGQKTSAATANPRKVSPVIVPPPSDTSIE